MLIDVYRCNFQNPMIILMVINNILRGGAYFKEVKKAKLWLLERAAPEDGKKRAVLQMPS